MCEESWFQSLKRTFKRPSCIRKGNIKTDQDHVRGYWDLINMVMNILGTHNVEISCLMVGRQNLV
jgi:hypothetical protein